MAQDKLMLEKNQQVGEDILNLPDEEFVLVERKEEIRDIDFKSEATSYFKDVLGRFVKRKISVVAASMILLIVVFAIIGPMISGYVYNEQMDDRRELPPRIPGLENIGIFDGTRVYDIQATNLAEYEKTGSLLKVIKEFDFVTSRNTTKMLTIKYNVYVHTANKDNYHWFGSDALGRDMFTRVWMGARNSLKLAVCVVAINLTIGLIIGSIAGYYGGAVDFFLTRAMEILNAIPQLPLQILIIVRMGTTFLSLMLCFVLTGWIGIAYSVRMQFYRYKGMEYVLASRTMGAKDRRIMYKYILPNAAGTLITVCALTLPFVIFQEAGLSYIGLGIQAPEASIGTLLNDGQKMLLNYPHHIVFPSVIIVLLMLSFNLFGNGLRDAFNPALRR